MNKIIPCEKILGYANREKAMQMMDFAIDQFRVFKPVDFFIFHSALISFGILVGTFFADFFKKYKIFMILGFLFSCIYLIAQIFQSLDD